MKATSKDLIIDRLLSCGEYLAVHEMKIIGYSENNICTRVSELAKSGIIEGRYRKGFNFKEWKIKESDTNE